jgi:hypothetical protein
MKMYRLGIEEATQALLVSRAVSREWSRNSATTPAEAIEQLVAKISLENILYESSDDELSSDDDEQHRLMAIRAELRVDPLQTTSTDTASKIAPSTTSNIRSPDAEPRKAARKRQLHQQSPRKSSKHVRSSSSSAASSTSRGSTKGTPTLAGRKRGVDEICDKHQQQQQASSQCTTGPARGKTDSVSPEVDAKIGSKQRAAANSDSAAVNNDGNTRPPRGKRAKRPAEDLIGADTAVCVPANINSGVAPGH